MSLMIIICSSSGRYGNGRAAGGRPASRGGDDGQRASPFGSEVDDEADEYVEVEDGVLGADSWGGGGDAWRCCSGFGAFSTGYGRPRRGWSIEMISNARTCTGLMMRRERQCQHALSSGL